MKSFAVHCFLFFLLGSGSCGGNCGDQRLRSLRLVPLLTFCNPVLLLNCVLFLLFGLVLLVLLVLLSLISLLVRALSLFQVSLPSVAFQNTGHEGQDSSEFVWLWVLYVFHSQLSQLSLSKITDGWA